MSREVTNIYYRGGNMKSYEVLKSTMSTVGVKSLASTMKISPSMLYKWSETSSDEDSAGAINPLDRISQICRITGSKEPIKWLCREVNGYFVENSNENSSIERYPFRAVHKILKDFSQLLEVVSTSIEDDDIIDRDEAIEIRSEWEDLKSKTEAFVKACENGKFELK